MEIFFILIVLLRFIFLMYLIAKQKCMDPFFECIQLNASGAATTARCRVEQPSPSEIAFLRTQGSHVRCLRLGVGGRVVKCARKWMDPREAGWGNRGGAGVETVHRQLSGTQGKSLLYSTHDKPKKSAKHFTTIQTVSCSRVFVSPGKGRRGLFFRGV